MFGLAQQQIEDVDIAARRGPVNVHRIFFGYQCRAPEVAAALCDVIEKLYNHC